MKLYVDVQSLPVPFRELLRPVVCKQTDYWLVGHRACLLRLCHLLLLLGKNPSQKQERQHSRLTWQDVLIAVLALVFRSLPFVPIVQVIRLLFLQALKEEKARKIGQQRQA